MEKISSRKGTDKEEDVYAIPTPGTPAQIGCPACGGPMRKITGDGPLRYHCEAGHRYTARYLLETMDEDAEESLWVALRLFQDQARIYRQFAHTPPSSHPSPKTAIVLVYLCSSVPVRFVLNVRPCSAHRRWYS
ncbi:MAG TPA: hypothetical protein PLG17_07595 [Thermodesulfobacteriota bacterium]|nr:hypothetical protein [Deltaproteobacteria bacterium]HNU71933.1 hypothetical protein [Thermodesulfobacteriota bacterium]HOC39543.1 hypothetical protein [Thermodesulfobacteriota bacterium]HQO78361.1 hypothetical protein [Thermodesulfobacteriota bacterium]